MPRKTSKNKNSLPNIAIIGARSFKGTKLLDYFEKKNEFGSIIALDVKPLSKKYKEVKFYEIDLTETLVDVKLSEIFKKEKIDIVVHCAIRSKPPKRVSLAHEIISVGTMYILNACAEAKIKKIILASTTDVYGALPSNPNFLSEDIHRPQGFRHSSFLKDKIDAENQVIAFGKKYPKVTTTILRPCTILGPTAKSFKTDILRRLYMTTVLGFDPLLQFVHEDDMLESFIMAIRHDFKGIFNIVGTGVIPLSKVVQIAGKINVRLPQTGFKTLVQILWYLNRIPAPASHVNFLRYICIADGSKAREKMSFFPEYSSKEALLSFIKASRLRELKLVK